MYGAMIRLSWRTKYPKHHGKLGQVMTPGDCVSVEQLESTTMGFFAQLKGGPTKQCYHISTICTHHYSDLIYVHFQYRLLSDKTVQYKRAFEA